MLLAEMKVVNWMKFPFSWSKIIFVQALLLLLLPFRMFSREEENFKSWLLQENFNYFRIGLDPTTSFPYDHIFLNQAGKYKIGKYTSPTSIGLWAMLLADILKGEVEFPQFSQEEALKHLERLILNLEQAPKWKGLFYWYELKEGVKVTEDEIISTYDNGNLSISLMIVYSALRDSTQPKERELAHKVYRLLGNQQAGWKALYDSKRGLLYAGCRRGLPLAGIWIDRFYSEGRLSALVAIILAEVPSQVWSNLLRRENLPAGEYQLSDGRRLKFFKPYQGAFQAWLPLLFVPEGELSPALDVAHRNYALIQQDYALQSGLPLLRSASANPGAKQEYLYEPSIGIYNASQDWVRSDIGSPYATALMYSVEPEASLALFKQALDKFPQIVGPLGFYDAISEKGEVARVFLALDQLQLILAFLSEQNQKYFMEFVREKKKEGVLQGLYSQIKFQP